MKNSEERIEVQNTYNSMYSQNIKIPLYIGEDEIYTDERKNFDKPLALARGQRLQAASNKLQAPSCKLDKKEL